MLQLFVWSCDALQGIKNIFVACLFKFESLHSCSLNMHVRESRGQCTPLHMRVFTQAKPRPPCPSRWGRWRSRTARSSETRPNEVWNAPSIFQMEWFTDLSRTVCLWSLTETQAGTFIFFKLMLAIMKIEIKQLICIWSLLCIIGPEKMWENDISVTRWMGRRGHCFS